MFHFRLAFIISCCILSATSPFSEREPKCIHVHLDHFSFLSISWIFYLLIFPWQFPLILLLNSVQYSMCYINTDFFMWFMKVSSNFLVEIHHPTIYLLDPLGIRCIIYIHTLKALCTYCRSLNMCMSVFSRLKPSCGQVLCVSHLGTIIVTSLW